VRDANDRVAGVALEDANGGETRVAASLVIGADGLRSTVARLAGSETRAAGRHAAGVVYGYFAALGNDGFHWHFRHGASVGRIPTNDGLTCVFAATTARRFHEEISRDVAAGFSQLLAEAAPELARAVADAHRLGGLRGFAGQPGFVRQSSGPGYALVGDAGHFKDPITAHGITDALRDAELLADAVAEGGDAALARYEERREELARGIFSISDRVASFEWTLAELEALHLALSDEMKREVAALEERHAQPDPAGCSA
jgi:2-polyprenyl-6-methoxyphenol hydroxylase-like FAD-dependent oxidoreductase